MRGGYELNLNIDSFNVEDADEITPRAPEEITPRACEGNVGMLVNNIEPTTQEEQQQGRLVTISSLLSHLEMAILFSWY